MNRSWMWPAIGVLVAIAITTAMDANGLLPFSALPLAALLALFWFIDRCTRAEVGFAWGRARHYGLALLHPALVIGVIVVAAALAGAIDIAHTDWRKTGLNLALVIVSNALLATITEEGFFRGWLWASLKRTGARAGWIVLWTSLAFSAWHISAVLLDTSYAPVRAQIPIFLVNVAVVGAIWGMFRLISGSVLVTSLVHGVWNGLAYVLFGFGTKVGALGIQNTVLFGPEIGWAGLVLNALFAVTLWQWYQRKRPVVQPAANENPASVR